MIRPNYLSEIKSRISASENGAVFVAADFTDITDKKTASGRIKRGLEADGLIKRVLRGVYYKLEYSDFLREYIAPIPINVAQRLPAISDGRLFHAAYGFEPACFINASSCCLALRERRAL